MVVVFTTFASISRRRFANCWRMESRSATWALVAMVGCLELSQYLAKVNVKEEGIKIGVKRDEEESRTCETFHCLRSICTMRLTGTSAWCCCCSLMWVECPI